MQPIRKSKAEAIEKIKQCMKGQQPKTVSCQLCGKVWPVESNVMKRGYHNYCKHMTFCWECSPCGQRACFKCRMEGIL